MSTNKISIDGVYVVSGPAKLVPVSGKIELFGAELTEPVVIPVGRSVPIIAKHANVDVFPNINILRKGNENIYKKAEDVAEKLSQLDPPVILIGLTDVGKSTIAFWAASLAKLRGERTKILSTDVGQNEVYLPGFEALAGAELPLVPGKVKADKMYTCFVGSFTPLKSLSRYYSCFSSLLRVTDGWTIVDTDGWVELWSGLESKVALLRIANEGTPVVIGSKQMAELLRRFGFEVRFFESVAEGKKNREERRRNRIRMLSSIITRSQEKAFKIDNLNLVGFPIFNCKKELINSFSRILFAERCEDGREVIVTKGRVEVSAGIRILRDGWERGLFVGLSGEEKLKDRPGLLTKINYRSRMINIFVEKDVSPRIVMAGSERFEEVLSVLKT